MGQNFFHRINFVNPDHVHMLMDLPTNRTIEDLIKLVKGNSSRWINESGIVAGRFSWGRGYGAFSVSHSNVGEVTAYIARQESHHRKYSFAEEYRMFVDRYGLKWRDEETSSPKKDSESTEKNKNRS